MPQPFDDLRERLLRAGFSPWRVGRYCRELADHLADLTADELAAGRDVPEAAAAARLRLGSDDTLAAAMFSRPLLRSWTTRAPWAVLVLAPIAFLALAYLVPLAALQVWIGSRLAPSSEAFIRSVCAFDAVALPSLLAASIALAAARQRLDALWPVLGVLVIACLGAGLRAQVLWPDHHHLWPGHAPVDRMHWTIGIGFVAISRSSIYLGRFRETGLLVIAIGAASYWPLRLRSARA